MVFHNCIYHIHMHTMHCFNGHLPGKPGLGAFQFDCRHPLFIILERVTWLIGW